MSFERALRSPLLRGAWFVGLATLLLAGCGSGKGSVEGTVTQSDGQPLVGARVILRSSGEGEAKKTANGKTDESGHYVLGTINKGDGILPGVYSVGIVENRGSIDNIGPRTIPARYSRGSTSGLTLTVEPGEHRVFDINLEAE